MIRKSLDRGGYGGFQVTQVARAQFTAFYLPVDPRGDEIQVLGLAITLFFLFRFGHIRRRRRQIVDYFGSRAGKTKKGPAFSKAGP